MQQEEEGAAAAGRDRDLSNFLLDLSDDSCPAARHLHLPAYNGDAATLSKGLESYGDQINSKIRPFGATPLRLAATAGCMETLEALLDAGAAVDEVDVKAQTALFVALVNQHWNCAKLLLERGADPNGDIKNLCTPISVMAQRGYYEGVKLLCQYGADTEDVYRLTSGMPGLAIAIAATYHHLKCFAALLLFGAKPGLAHLEQLRLPLQVTTQCSVPHAIIKYRCPPEFVYLFYEFGGNLMLRDSRQRLATEIADEAPALELMKHLQGTPRSLQSTCRIALRRSLFKDGINRHFDQVTKFDLPATSVSYLRYSWLLTPANYETYEVAATVASTVMNYVAQDTLDNMANLARVKRTTIASQPK